MDFSALSPAALIVAIMSAATPLLFAAIGELVVEKSGVLNLGVEGMMIFGAIAGFAISVETGSPYLGIIGGAIGGAAIALIFGFLTQFLMSNQVATGLGLTLFGLGLSALVGQPYSGVKPPRSFSFEIGFLSEKPVSIDYMIPVSILLVVAVAWFLKSTRSGLILRSVGENHDAAHSLGYNVIRIRLMAIAFGGACAGVGGAYLSLIRVPQWTEGMTAGAGWIALAIVVFASWKPWRAVIGAYLFGGVTIIQLNLQSLGIPIQSQYLSMTPFLVTILVLVIISSDKRATQANAPASLGRVFEKSG
jgi:simple sugar transport system permease protein